MLVFTHVHSRMLQDMKPVDDSKIHVVEDNDNVIEFKKDDDTPTT